MILSREDIFERLRDGSLRFDPEVPDENVAQVSIDLRLGRTFSVPKEPPEFMGPVRMDPSLWASQDLWEHVEDEGEFVLEPGQLVLAQTLENVTVPPDLVGWVEGRSSWARVGVTIHVTAPKIDPGFSGTITLELVNLGKLAIRLVPGEEKLAQLMLLSLSRPVPDEHLYGTRPEDRFQGQDRPLPGSPGT